MTPDRDGLVRDFGRATSKVDVSLTPVMEGDCDSIAIMMDDGCIMIIL